MIRFSLSGVFKFLFGILLLQAATGVLVVAALRTDNREVWILLGVFALILNILGALWFVSISKHTHKDTVNHMKEAFLREREKIRVRAEREKTKLVEKSHQRIIRDRNRTQGKASMKVGASFVGALAVGGIMLFTQFVTMGMLLMTTAGGALAGYAFRTRQEIGRKEKQAIGSKPPEKLIGSAPARRAIASLVGKKSDLE
jgi:uncharacterized membrane protein YeiB